MRFPLSDGWRLLPQFLATFLGWLGFAPALYGGAALEVFDISGNYVDVTPYSNRPVIGGSGGAFTQKRFRDFLRFRLSGEPQTTVDRGVTIVELPYEVDWRHCHPYLREVNGRWEYCDSFTTEYALTGKLFYEFWGDVFKGASIRLNGRATHKPEALHDTAMEIQVGAGSPLFPSLLHGSVRYLGGEQGESPSDCQVFDHGIEESHGVVYERFSNGYSDATGVIHGTIRSLQPTLTSRPNSVQRAQVILSRLPNAIRSQSPTESDVAYQAYRRAAVQERTTIAARFITEKDEGRFSFRDVPRGHVRKVGGISVLSPAYYLLEVVNGETDQWVLNEAGVIDMSRTETLYFAKGQVENETAKTDLEAGGAETLIALQAVDGIAAKQKLIDDISPLSAAHYQPIETLVQRHLDSLKATLQNPQATLSPEALEGLQRAVWAERAVWAGADNARLLIDPFAKGLANLLGDLVEELAGVLPSLKGQDHKSFENFDEALDFAALERRGMKGFGGNITEQQIGDHMRTLVERNPAVFLSELTKFLKYAAKVLFAAIESTLVLAGMDEGLAANIAAFAKVEFLTLLDIFVHQGFGSLETLAKTGLEAAIDRFKEVFFDNATGYSYTGLTAPSLELSQRSFESWQLADRPKYLHDATSVAQVIGRMNDEVTDDLQSHLYQLALADSFDLLEGGFEQAGRVSPHAKTLALIAKVVKYVNNGAVIGNTFRRLYLSIPRDVEIAVHYVFGQYQTQGPRPMTLSARPAGPAASLPPAGPFNTLLLTRLRQAQQQLESATFSLAGRLEGDDIGGAIAAFDPAQPESYGRKLNDFRRANALYLAQASAGRSLKPAAVEALEPLSTGTIELLARADLTLGLARDLFYKVGTLEFDSSTNATYRAQRHQLTRALYLLNYLAGEQVKTASGLQQELAATNFPATLVVEDLTLTSESTGGGSVTRSPETFVARALVRNISMMAASGVSAQLRIDAPTNSLVPHTASEIVVGSLAADDGVEGNGPDERVLEWKVTYSGPLVRSESLVLTVELLEADGPPKSWEAFPETGYLSIETQAFDPDLDNMSSDYERAHGLNPALDDAAADLDRDGASNLAEYRARTLPEKPDTDADGLPDGEELSAGTDGVVTDPLEADTDSDGLPDSLDPTPIDPLPSSAPGSGEPELQVDRRDVTLTEARPFAIVKLINRGGGTLRWTASSANPALVKVNAEGLIWGGEHNLFISASQHFNFGFGAAHTTVRVADAGGATRQHIDIGVLLSRVAPITSRLEIERAGDELALRIVGESGQTIAVQQAPTIVAPEWSLVQTLTLTNSSQVLRVNLPARTSFWRLQAP